MSNQHFDIIIAGSGVGGLSTLLYLKETELYKKGELRIAILSKSLLNTTNTDWAQGGIAAVHSLEDNFEQHIEDTLIAGAFENNRSIVEKIVKAGPSIMQDLIRWNMNLDKNEEDFDLVKEGGHSAARIWHWKDQTGHALQKCLSNQLQTDSNISIFENTFIIEAQKDDEKIFHVKTLSKTNGAEYILTCSVLILATGGIGCLYEKTTNQSISTCDGIALASQLGAEIENLCYVQFHPTGLFHEGQISFLISEAVRGAGAELKNKYMVPFMSKYDKRGSLAPRDIVSRSILQEMNETNETHVLLDTTLISVDYFQSHFPNIIAHCKKVLKLDPTIVPIPVVPVQHYSCGGVKVNEFGETSVKGLYAVGEVASTGLHGANRLASNSLLEAITFGKFISDNIISNEFVNKSEARNLNFNKPSLKKVSRNQIQSLMSQHAGVVRSNASLEEGLAQLHALHTNSPVVDSLTIEDVENNNLLRSAILLINDALQKRSNKGTHFNIDLL